MKCSMDELKFAATWKSSGIQGAKFSIKVIFNTTYFVKSYKSIHCHILLHKHVTFQYPNSALLL